MASGRYLMVNSTPMRVTGMSDTVNRNAAFEEACDILVASYAVGGPFAVSGTIDMLYRPAAVGTLMRAMMGIAGSGAIQFGDTPTEVSISIGDDQGGYKTTYTGCGISSFELTLSTRDFVRTRWTWIGSGATSKQTLGTQEAAPADEAAVFYNASVGGITCKGATLRIDRKFDTDYYYIGSPFLQGLYQNGQTEFGGTLTLGAGQYDELARVIAGSTSADDSISAAANELSSISLSIVLKDKDGSTLDTITAGNLIFNEMNRSVTGRNQWDKTINFRCVCASNADFAIT
jgi:hypothetical protein